MPSLGKKRSFFGENLRQISVQLPFDNMTSPLFLTMNHLERLRDILSKTAAVGTNTTQVSLKKHPMDGSKGPGSQPTGRLSTPQNRGTSGKASGFRVGAAAQQSNVDRMRTKMLNRSA